jgi:fibronectin-binding autotransporter adhesin
VAASLVMFIDNANLAFDRSDPVIFSGVISGTGSVQQTGIGTTILTGDNTYAGSTTIAAGTLQLGNGGATGSVAGNIVDNGILAVNRSDTVTLPGVISGSGSLQQNGPGTTTLTADNTYTGGTTITAGTLQLGNGATAGSITGNVTDNGTLAFDRSEAVTFGGVVSGTGSLSQQGPGTLTLTGRTPTRGAQRSAPERCRSAMAPRPGASWAM